MHDCIQADGGIKKGRAAFGDLTNHAQGQEAALLDKVSTRVLLQDLGLTIS